MRALAPAGEILFFAPPKKSIQKKSGPEACPLRGFPALLVKTGACSTRDLAPLDRSNSRKLHPVFTAMLGCAYGKVDLKPVVLTEYRSQSGEQARTLFEVVYGAGLCPVNRRVVRGPGLARNAGDRRSR
jgi:hypothetical protein